MDCHLMMLIKYGMPFRKRTRMWNNLNTRERPVIVRILGLKAIGCLNKMNCIKSLNHHIVEEIMTAVNVVCFRWVAVLATEYCACHKKGVGLGGFIYIYNIYFFDCLNARSRPELCFFSSSMCWQGVNGLGRLVS